MTKKTAKKTASRKKAPAKAVATALPNSEDIPEGMKQLGGGYAETWKPEVGDSIHGRVTGGVREVELTIGRKKQQRRCMEVTRNHDQKRFTIWESAALGDLFDEIAEQGEGAEVFLRLDGFGKKKAGQNPPKLFTVATAA